MPRAVGRRQTPAGARGPYSSVPLRRCGLPLLARWLHRPPVCAWRGPPIRELATIRRNLANPRVSHCLILLRGRPIGALKCYDPAGDWTSALPFDPHGTRGLDLFFGEAGFQGKGHGSALLRWVPDSLLARADDRRVIADPDLKNRASIRAFEKAGFCDAGETILSGERERLLVRGQWSLRDRARFAVARVLSRLPPREAELLKRRHGIGAKRGDLAEAGRQFSITRERIRQIEARALARLGRRNDKGPGVA